MDGKLCKKKPYSLMRFIRVLFENGLRGVLCDDKRPIVHLVRGKWSHNKSDFEFKFILIEDIKCALSRKLCITLMGNIATEWVKTATTTWLYRMGKCECLPI